MKIVTTLNITAMANSTTLISRNEHASQNAISIESLSLYKEAGAPVQWVAFFDSSLMETMAARIEIASLVTALVQRRKEMVESVRQRCIERPDW